MPHLVILYTPNLEADVDLSALCRTLADTMLAERDESGGAVFPPGGVRVLALPATHFAVADGRRDYAFVYLNLRMGRGRAVEVQRQAGQHLLDSALRHLASVIERRYVGVTLQVDEGHEVFDARRSSIHPLFQGI